MNNLTVGGEIIAIIILIALSAFFAGSETAMTAASRARLHGLAQKGDKRAQQVIDIRRQGERMIGALLMGNSTVNILASSLATSVMITLFSEGGVFYATAIMTALIVIFAEVMPKTYALYNADKMSTAVAPLVKLTIMVFAPFLVVIEAIVKFILNLFGSRIDHVSVGSNIEELRGAIELHQGQEVETQEQRAMLHSILDLDDVWVSEIMTHRQMMKTIDLNQPVNDIVQEVLDSQYTRIPVYKDDPDNIIGVIHAKALLRELQGAGGRAELVDVEKLASEPWFIPDSTSLFDQLQAFRERREHFALVVDEYGSLMGVVTLEDILEEIVGDIDDEHDVAVAGVRKQPNGSFMIDGTVTIRDLNREFEWKFPDENYATLAGLILYEAEKIPEAGQVFNFHGFRFDIVRRQRNQITLVRVTPPKRENEVEEV